MGKTTNKLLAIARRRCREARRGSRPARRASRVSSARRAQSGRRTPPSDLEGIVDGLFQELEELVKGVAVMGELTPRATDAISSYGERLSSEICRHRVREAWAFPSAMWMRGMSS